MPRPQPTSSTLRASLRSTKRNTARVAPNQLLIRALDVAQVTVEFARILDIVIHDLLGHLTRHETALQEGGLIDRLHRAPSAARTAQLLDFF